MWKVRLNEIKRKEHLCGDVHGPLGAPPTLRLFGVLRVPPAHVVQIHRRESCRTQTEKVELQTGSFVIVITSRPLTDSFTRRRRFKTRRRLQTHLDGITVPSLSVQLPRSIFPSFISFLFSFFPPNFKLFVFFQTFVLILCALSLLYFSYGFLFLWFHFSFRFTSFSSLRSILMFAFSYLSFIIIMIIYIFIRVKKKTQTKNSIRV